MGEVPLQDQFVQKWLRRLARIKGLRGRDRILRAFSDPDTQPSRPFESTYFGIPYIGNLNNFIDWQIFYYGAFAEHELHLLGAIAGALRGTGRQVNFFDVGANVGSHTLFMSQHADHVFAFEPFAPVREKMLAKLSHAGIGNATIFPVALGDQTETANYTAPAGANQGTGTLGEAQPDNAGERILVDVARGDDFFASHSLPPVSLLKMDVEGYEIQALTGMRQTLWRDRPPILMEIQNTERTAVGEVAGIRELLYPNHLIFGVYNRRDNFWLGPPRAGETVEALVLPAEMAGIVPGTGNSAPSARPLHTECTVQ